MTEFQLMICFSTTARNCCGELVALRITGVPQPQAPVEGTR